MARVREQHGRVEAELVGAKERLRVADSEHTNGMRARDLELQAVKQLQHETGVRTGRYVYACM